MAQYQYRTFDVFTDTRFGGNPLAVVLDATGLTTGQMQTIMREFSYSEATFVLPPETPEGTAKVRIFSPGGEMPFAGHPTIGTAICLAEQAQAETGPAPTRLVLEEGVGPIPCEITFEDGRLHATLTTHVPLHFGSEVSVETVAELLGLPTDAIRTTGHGPQFASKGVLYLLVEIASPDLLAQVTLNHPAFVQADATYPEAEGDVAVAAYAHTGPGAIDMRMFSPLDGIIEDPATGSAAAALGAVLHHLSGQPQRFTITQGVTMGRPSTIHVTAEGDTVTVGGTAVAVMDGTLTVD
ncbi:MAG: PhzF family phenazine biosynthesis protein [Pseudomonadota bacterium]